VGNGSGLSRGDRNRNAPMARLRELVPHGNAIVGIDLADDKQAAVDTDHHSRVIARRQVRARAWEPTGHRWRVTVGLRPRSAAFTAAADRNLYDPRPAAASGISGRRTGSAPAAAVDALTKALLRPAQPPALSLVLQGVDSPRLRG
jgi:hypothetical protein